MLNLLGRKVEPLPAFSTATGGEQQLLCWSFGWTGRNAIKTGDCFDCRFRLWSLSMEHLQRVSDGRSYDRPRSIVWVGGSAAQCTMQWSYRNFPQVHAPISNMQQHSFPTAAVLLTRFYLLLFSFSTLNTELHAADHLGPIWCGTSCGAFTRGDNNKSDRKSCFFTLPSMLMQQAMFCAIKRVVLVDYVHKEVYVGKMQTEEFGLGLIRIDPPAF